MAKWSMSEMGGPQTFAALCINGSGADEVAMRITLFSVRN
jgi:hypothetical protein